MSSFSLSVGPAVGETVYIKSLLDQWKGVFDVINISFYKPFVIQYRGTHAQQYWKFINEYGKLFFSDPLYNFVEQQYQFMFAEDIISKYKLQPLVRNYTNILCHPTYKHGFTDYVVLTTKLRLIPRSFYNQIKDKLFGAIKNLSKKYKIMIVGEREIEYNEEYAAHGTDQIYSIYKDIISNIPKEKIIDMTIPGMGITVPSVEQIQKDCNLFRDSKFTIVLGFGGHFCLSSATSNVMCFNMLNCISSIGNWFDDTIHPTLFITKVFDDFISEINKRAI
ncbi:MAG: hypothetical protein WC679_13830 [Bacteroidales bacterium]|jgi:hypothetical protein